MENLEQVQDDRDSVNREMQMVEEKYGQANIEDFDQVSKESEHPVDLIVPPLLEKSVGSLEFKSMVPVVSQEDQVVEVPHIDFIFKDCLWNLDDCTQIWQILRLQYLMGKAHI